MEKAVNQTTVHAIPSPRDIVFGRHHEGLCVDGLGGCVDVVCGAVPLQTSRAAVQGAKKLSRKVSQEGLCAPPVVQNVVGGVRILEIQAFGLHSKHSHQTRHAPPHPHLPGPR